MKQIMKKMKMVKKNGKEDMTKVELKAAMDKMMKKMKMKKKDDMVKMVNAMYDEW